jgi:hypothetical protein
MVQKVFLLPCRQICFVAIRFGFAILTAQEARSTRCRFSAAVVILLVLGVGLNAVIEFVERAACPGITKIVKRPDAIDVVLQQA